MKNKMKVLLVAVLMCAVLAGCSSMGKEEKQLLIKQSTYNENGELIGWTEYEYDEEGNKLKLNNYNGSSELTETIVYTYDEEGNKNEVINLDNGDFMRAKWVYDKNGNVLEFLSLEQGKDGEVYEYSKRVKSYDEQGRVKKDEFWIEGKIKTIQEYIYEDKNKEVERTMNYNDKEEIASEWSEERIYNDNGEVVKEYVYLDEENLYQWVEYVYNTQGDCIERREYGADGSVWNIERCEYLYDDMGNIIQWRDLKDFSGDLGSCIHPDTDGGKWGERSYDEWGNIVEYITYDEDRNRRYEKYVNEYKTIEIDKQMSDQKEEKKVEKTLDREKAEFMKAIYDCMVNKNYEAISGILETRDTMWNTLYFQNNQLVDKLADGEALIYSYGSGIYYGQVVNGKRQGRGVQWKEDLRWPEESGSQYYYIDGEWKDNKGNGYCKIYYSLRGFTKEKTPIYAYIEGNYTDSLEDGEMRATWLGADQSICTDTYQAYHGEIQGNIETDENGYYKICEDESETGNIIWSTSTVEMGFPRKIYDQID